ncbi:hypothetical protein ACOZ4I_17940 (plasmid) [Haloarcula salina]|uniref:hypothetical protein n=1 Tax=Haloarcula salina TaxID=1429914 RepID=UPI003C6FB3D8
MRVHSDEQKLDQSTEKVLTRRRALEGVLSVAATATALPVLSGEAAAHFPTALAVDVQPDNARNFIDLEAHDSVTVAVSPSTVFENDGESTTFEPTERAVRYRFGSRHALEGDGGARPVDDGEVVQLNDGHGSGSEALALTFPVADTGFDGGEETGWLYWERDESGDHGYAGVDSVRVYGTDTSNRKLLDLLRQLVSVDDE